MGSDLFHSRGLSMSAFNRGAALICGSLIIFGLAPPAFAVDHNHLVPTGTYDVYCSEGVPGDARVCQTDNANVSFYMDSNGTFELEQEDRNAVNDAISLNYQPTVLSVQYDSTPVFSGSGETDWVYQEGTLPSPYVGYTWCDDVAGDLLGYKCDQTYIRIRGDDTYTSGLACHETGHAAGLVHGAKTTSQYGNQDSTHMGCMVKDGVPALATLKTAQKNDINDVY